MCNLCGRARLQCGKVDKLSTGNDSTLKSVAGSTEYRKLPKTTENYRKQPKTTENYRKLIYPKYRKLPKTTPDWFLLMLECTEKYQSTLT